MKFYGERITIELIVDNIINHISLKFQSSIFKTAASGVCQDLKNKISTVKMMKIALFQP